ncbi:MAG TPA: hypothetical protein VFX75_03670 [Nitrososphaeraceae archaeon]|nr:hypothetical protein [Nitrososphaeraceae archaeon]
MIKFLFVFIIFVFSIAVSSFPQSAAQESSNSTAQYALQLRQLKLDGVGNIEILTYGVFYVTSKDTCDDSDNERLNFYQVLTDEYLSLYRLNYKQDYVACISEKEFNDYFSTISPTVVPIVIVDEIASQKILIQQGNYGLFTISGIGSESILVCACDADIESWQGAWILSHELSHLILYRYKAPESVYFTWVHYNEAMTHACMILTQAKFCPEYSTIIISPTGHPIPVMEIFGQGSTSYNMPATPPQLDVPILQKDLLKSELVKALIIQASSSPSELKIISSVAIDALKPLSVDGNPYPVPYNITGGIIQEFYADSLSKKLIIGVIGGENGGKLQLKLSREIMDSIQGSKDTRFVVYSQSSNDTNKKQIDYVEIQTNTETRTLGIDFPQDKTLIEITGTMVVPEFPLPALMLIISICSLLVVYKIKLEKSKYSVI